MRDQERWTKDEITDLCFWWVKYELSATSIAGRLKRSRGSVLGKIFRLGLIRKKQSAKTK